MIWHILSIGFLALFAGCLAGGREAQHADAKVFEKAFNVLPRSFWGSLSWLRKYDSSGKEFILYTPLSDFWHVANWLRKGLLIAASVLSCYHLTYHIALLGGAIYLLDTIAQATTYKLLRYGKLT